jgi:transposase
MGTKRRTFSEEFKLDAVNLVIQQGYKLSEAARSLGISANLLGRWKQAFELAGGNAFPGKGRLAPQDQELAALRKENKRLRMERDILKKAATLFANESKRGWP